MAKLNKQPRKKFSKAVGDTTNPDGLYWQMQRYLDALKIKHYTKQTLHNNERYIRDFIAWCDIRALRQAQEITKHILESYQRYLYLYRQSNGKPLSIYSQRCKLVPLRSWFKWLTKQNELLYNPASELELPRLSRRLPKAILTSDEVEQVMQQTNINEPIGLRDRAVLELLYSTGIRRMEIINLSIYDIDLARGTLLIRQGKGKKDRMLPLGERASYWLNQYLNNARNQYLTPKSDNILFLTRLGEKFNEAWLSRTVAQYIDKAKLNKRGSCHLFRHTMATLMLENGADIRFIQAMLGHAELSTTEIYTQVSLKKLKEVHALTHPAKLTTKEQTQTQQENQADDHSNNAIIIDKKDKQLH